MKIFFLILLLLPTLVSAQCLSGNCENGKGRYDFGWCRYEGEFRDGKPEGTGTMTYSDYVYTGEFRNGVEDGNGTILKNGNKEAVTYRAGKKMNLEPEKVAAGEWKTLEGRDPGCVSGDCVNGQGTYQFESGNKYSGAFKNRKREGQGSATYANGDSFSGSWHNNEREKGTFTWANGIRYVGTYDAQGRELNGQYRNGAMTIPVENGVAKIPARREAALDAGAPSGGLKQSTASKVNVPCGACHGSGKTHTTIYGGGVTIDKYGNRTTTFGEYSNCTACGGTGVAR